MPRAWHGLDDWIGAVRLGRGEGIVGEVATRREGTNVNDFRTSGLPSPLFLERTQITAALVEPLLYWSRLQGFARQQSTGPLAPCDLATLVQEAVELTRPRWKEEPESQGRTVAVRIALEPLPAILGTPAEIREALTNRCHLPRIVILSRYAAVCPSWTT